MKNDFLLMLAYGLILEMFITYKSILIEKQAIRKIYIVIFFLWKTEYYDKF